ncbi:CD209 antigen-like protein E [Etheostoma spectabile]|uniref:CD209 antigen-like protein E n=1 Tax=Etheostoma spectabile TaxID=54343 RepID=UPI0013AED542|nr:CD209 antigen-like protein E [Etheostoma spectabile]
MKNDNHNLEAEVQCRASQRSRRPPNSPHTGLQQDFKHLVRMKRNPQEEIEEINEEDNNYVNAPAWTVDEVAAPPDQRSLFFSRSSPLIAVCWLILLVIMGLRIYFTPVINDCKLTAENQQLETQRNNLTKQIQDLETNWNKLNVSRAQWSIDAYCPKDNSGRRCKACQEGWELTGPSCYEVHDVVSSYRKTWEEAREDCRGKGSDLAVYTKEEHGVINKYSAGSSGTDGYWFGLRAEGGRWKWVDGSDLTESHWTPQPPPATDGQCAMSVQNAAWQSVKCAEKKRWICIVKALSF